MNKFNLLLFFLFLSMSLFGQDVIQKETSEVFLLLKGSKRNTHLEPKIDDYTIGKIANALSEDCFIRKITINDSLYVDSVCLTREERCLVDSFVQSLFSQRWTEQDMSLYGLSGFKIIDDKQAQLMPDFNYVVYQIAKPLFIRDYSLCFLYHSYACGNLCGYGELSILIKVDNKWKHWRDLFTYAS